MKKIMKLFLFFIVLCIPYFVNANTISSDMIKMTEQFKPLEIGKVLINRVYITSYTKLFVSKQPGLLITLSINNNYERNTDLELKISLYDKNKNLIIDRIHNVTIKSLDTYSGRIEILASELSVGVNDIGYFKVTCENLSDVKILDSKITEDYYVENYNMVVNVLDNNVYEVEENYDAKFSKYAKVVDKYIPIRHRYISNDGSKVNKRAVITDIEVNDVFYDEIVKGEKKVVIGKVNKFSNTRKINFKYKYNVGKDELKNNDELVFYLIYQNKAQYDGAKFKIILPRNITDEKIDFINDKGKVIKDVTYKVKENVVTGEFTNVINPDSKYAIRILLDNDYFKKESNNITSLTVKSFLLSIIGVAFVISVYFLQKSSKRKVNYDKMYLSDKINSLEVGYLYHGEVKINDIASLLFCLANKGYVEIVYNKKGYKIVKKKDYQEDDVLEKAFMKELFLDNDEVSRKELMETLKDTKDIVITKLGDGKRKKRLFIREILNYKILFWIIITVIAGINVVNILEEYQPSVIKINLVLTVIGYVIIFRSIFGKGKIIERVLSSLVALIMIISPIVLSSYMAFMEDNLKLVAYIFGIVSMLVISCVSSLLNDRTRYGTKMLNKIEAYRNFLMKCNESTIINELQIDKNCLYKVLPYSLVLGISDRWVDKFKHRDVEAPIWYKKDNFELYEWYEDIKYIYSDVFIALKNNNKK